MAEKRVYMVHKGTKAVITSNRKQALDSARQQHATVSSIPWSLWRDAGYSMDLPTFMAYSDVVESFTGSKLK